MITQENKIIKKPPAPRLKKVDNGFNQGHVRLLEDWKICGEVNVPLLVEQIVD